VKNSNGTRIACGVLKEIDQDKVLYAELNSFANSSKSGTVVAHRLTYSTNSSLAPDPRTDNICFFVEGRGLTPNIQSFLLNKTSSDCNVTNGCGVHVHAGQSCTSTVSQMGHYWDSVVYPIDPWLLPGGSYLTTNEFGQTIYASCVATGKTSFEDQTFLLHEKNGTRVACGLLQPLGPPTPAPTSAKTLAPTLVDKGRNTTICFSGMSTVEIENNGFIPMKQLQIGDSVRSGNGIFTQVYGFGHFHHDLKAEFLQLHFDEDTSDSMIEISPKHLVFVERNKIEVTIPASEVVMGDILSGKKVALIQMVTRHGVYAPLTQSGDIMVGNIRASNYVDILDYSSVLWIDQHTLGHAYMFPRRLFCRFFMNYCKDEMYVDGYSLNVYVVVQLGSMINAFGGFVTMIFSYVTAPFVAIVM
jgi:Hint module